MSKARGVVLTTNPDSVFFYDPQKAVNWLAFKQVDRLFEYVQHVGRILAAKSKNEESAVFSGRIRADIAKIKVLRNQHSLFFATNL